jgi:hypothetical protein
MQRGHLHLNDGYEAVHWAANYDDVAALSTCLSSDAACASRRTSRGMTPLHICALNNSVRCVRVLVPLLPAATINAVNCWGETALHLACACDASDVRAALLDAGADTFAHDSWGRTPSETAAAAHGGQLTWGHALQSALSPHFLPPQTHALPSDTSAFNCELLSAISSRQLRSITPPVVRGIFSDSPPPPPTASAPTSARSSRRALSSLVEYPGDCDRVSALLQDATVDPAGVDSFGLTGACIQRL